jgi:hypothetical protein
MNKRQYKKEYFICKDDFGKNIYAGDTVEILTPWTFKTPWTSLVYYDRLHGAMVKGRAIFLDEEGKFSHLYSYLGNKPISIHTYGEDDPTTYTPYCKKIKSFL